MRGAITPADEAPGAHTRIDASAIVRLPLIIGQAIAPADQAPGAHTRIDAGAIVRRA
jgi:hypothetical protein